MQRQYQPTEAPEYGAEERYDVCECRPQFTLGPCSAVETTYDNLLFLISDIVFGSPSCILRTEFAATGSNLKALAYLK